MTNFIKKLVNGVSNKSQSSCCSIDIKEVDTKEAVAESCCGTESAAEGESCCSTDTKGSESSSCCG